MNATVKRKFNALVQGIGNNRSTTDLSTEHQETSIEGSSPLTPNLSRTMSTEEFLAKKRRVGGGGGTSTPTPSKFSTPASDRFATSTASIGSPGTATAILRKWTSAAAANNKGGGGSPSSIRSVISGTPVRTTTTTATPVKDGSTSGGLPPPKYCPGDREQLLRRLHTFQELTDWTPKPDRVNEIEWAKRGWVCLGKERVRCTLCARELVVKINRKEIDGREIAVLIASEIEEGIVKKYAEQVVEAHAEDCLWRKKGCDDSLLRLPLSSRTALSSLRQRYDELCDRTPFLPYEFNLRLPDSLNIDTVLSHLPPTFFTSPPPPPQNKNLPENTSPQKINRPALALALLGWQGLTNPRLATPIPNSASCHTCLRRLGLWMFKSKQVDEPTNTIIQPAPMDHLDPLREHRFFCPWKNGAVQRNPGSSSSSSSAGWEVLVQVLRNESFIRERVDGTATQHGRSKSSAATQGGQTKTPERPRPITAGGRTPRLDGQEGGSEYGETEADEEELRKKKDQDMMSRLRRVKSLFNTKGGKLKKTPSRPGTSHSTVGSTTPGGGGATGE